jgi:hypothetical protein
MPYCAFRIVIAAALLCALGASAEGATFSVANNGIDGPTCGPKASPCRSISQAIVNAAAGDKIVVGPGRYGVLIDTPAPGCDCVLAIDKAVTVLSTNGAAATVIDGRGVTALQDVLISGDGSHFGAPGKGFTVTNTDADVSSGLVIEASDVAVRGNQVVTTRDGQSVSTGIDASDAPGAVLIEANQVIGWNTGIRARGDDKTLRKNVSVLNVVGLDAGGTGAVVGNVVAANSAGIQLSGAVTAVGNAALGSSGIGITVNTPFSAIVEKNDIVGNDIGLDDVGVVGLDATKNFWGAATGPGGAPSNSLNFTAGSTVTFTPVATKAFKVRAPISP